MTRIMKTGLASLAVTLGAVAFGGFLANRHRNRDGDDAPDFARRNPNGALAKVGRSVTIRKPRAELFAYWRDFANLAGFMENLEAVETSGGQEGVSVWKIKAPAGQTVDVKTEVANETKDKLIAWRAVEGSDIETRGQVSFEDAPGDRGTRVSLTLAYDPPAGAIGRAAAKLFLREPQVQARHDLKRFKMLMETGEIATSVRTRDETRAAKQENA
ncbi:SRPBCC family protein [Erythrobacter litoralis]|uniref:SRPBCC family protein n=1 Tax=Erythrobacter litoralis TaxID=39960 RepID=UPI0024358088|nr:SRPBCC family protein [Erythrobacter litoralis]MDG6078125.1 SRPBCC family protein [Erythrobacter litoralis]